MSKIILESEVNIDKYVNFVADKFDLQNREINRVEIPMLDEAELGTFPWHIGIILGNSGSGKSTVLKCLGEPKNALYDDSKSIVSQFNNLTEEEVCNLFSSVGLNSIPTYLNRPNQLSNGQKARLDLCYSIANTPNDEIIYIDEFTSVVNRSCAKSMSYALQRYIRENNKRIILASCHFDIIEWLQPDWVYNLNKQVDGHVDIERFIYSDDKEYEIYNNINKKDILSDEKCIN